MTRSGRELIAENEDLRARLEEKEETLRAIRSGEVDSLVIMSEAGEQIFKLTGADQAYRIFLENMNEGALTVNADGLIIYANRRFAEMLKMPLEKVIGASIYLWVGLDSQPIVRSLLGKSADRKSRDELDLVPNEGAKVPIQFSASHPLAKGMEGIICLLVTDLSEINEFKRNERKLKLAASVFSHASEGILITDAHGQIITVNDAFTRITSYSLDEVQGRTPNILSSGLHDKEFFAALWHDLTAKGHWYGEILNRRKSGELYAEMLSINALRDSDGKVTEYVGLFFDITARKEQEKQLKHIAQYDALTNLPNRVLLADRMQQGMLQSLRHAQLLALAFLDLDGFKTVNDLHGHAVGDRLLIHLSSRMKAALRASDTLARIGGDEFVALLLDIGSIDACQLTLNRLLAAISQPVQIDGLVLHVTASLGVTVYPQGDSIEADQLLRQADQAMYLAKIAGKNRFHVFDPTLDINLRSYHANVEQIRRALVNREFFLYYQPKVNMRTGKIVGAEALIRWQHPEKGLLLPAEFLPVIEDHSLSVDLGEWVIDSALTQMEIWAEQGWDLPVSVNINARHLKQADFVDRLRRLLAAHTTVNPNNLEMEVLETSALEDMILASDVIEKCRALGVLFALDDFGTGYSSLTYLKRLPVRWLKIDQSFVRDMLDDPEYLSILTGVLSLALAFRREVIAEGVETAAHGAMLLQLGCDLAQGFGIARPMPAGEIPNWMVNWRKAPEWNNLPAIGHADLPVLFASAEHKAWVVTIESFLRGERAAPMQLDHHGCRFGAWLDSVSTARHAMQPAIKAIEPLHLQFHELATALCALHDQNRNEDALARVGELKELLAAMLSQLKSLDMD
jgi:diguanylate cyclase (GGDEF)-like protein/PAS domain S-box-containing protein